MKKVFLLALFCLFSIPHLPGQLKSPSEFFPHEMGEHFTPHHMLVDYYKHVAQNSPLVSLIEYGHTNEDRPLMLAFVTSEANHQNLDEIRKNNLRHAGLEEGDPDPALNRSITWLSFSVHGNEAAGSESAPYVLYDLVDPDNTRTKAWLENSVVVLDPSINPDGYSRYTHWVRGVAAKHNNPDINDIEHQEPWPGGRTNHYLFDLNRDWAWQTQVESQQRMKVYNKWLPHLHADLHEMGRESPYYFAPAAKPYHNYVTEWQREFQDSVGRNHAKYFNQEGWLYFTKESFDLFYPSYGDTYPIFSGGIGMTYEQGGGSAGARGVELQNGEILTLKDRVLHHKTTALSTAEIGSRQADALIENFRLFFENSTNNPQGKYRTYVIKKDTSGNRLRSLAEMLTNQGIRFGTVDATQSIGGFDYLSRVESSIQIEPGDMVVSALQPKSVLAQVLLNPDNDLEDSLTYDITAWSLPYAYGLHAFASTESIPSISDLSFDSGTSSVDQAYAYLIPWTDLESAKLAGALIKKGISIRVIPREVNYDNKKFSPGTLVITRADNKSKPDLVEIINKAIGTSRASIIPISSGYADSGLDLGSNRIDLIKKPKIVTLMGEGVSNYSFGQLKWYFDDVLEYPHTMVDLNQLSRMNLTNYTTLILPDGFYSLNKNLKDKVNTWVRSGGKVISIGRSTRNFVDAEGFALKSFATDEEKKDAKKEDELENLAARYHHYSDRERNFAKSMVPGAIFKLDVDDTHPMGFGLGDFYYSLRTSSTKYPLATGMSNVITHPKEGGQVIGFAGSKIMSDLKDSLVCGIESKGRGQIVYIVDNPLFRGFWYNGLFLFSNAIFMVN